MTRPIENRDKKYELLLENMDNGFALFRAIRKKNGIISDYSIEEVNNAWKEMMGLATNDLKTKTFLSVFKTRKFRDQFLNSSEIVLSGESIHSEIYFQQLDKYFRIYYLPVDKDHFATFITDITQLKNEIEASEHLVSIVEASDDAIFSESPEGTILSWNDGATQLYGYTPEETIGKLAYELNIYPEYESHKEFVARVKKGERIKNRETMHRRKDGSAVPVSITKSPIWDEKGNVAAISIIVQDITLLKNREEELTKARDAAEQAANLKSAFLANMSHEIRTPLNSILGFTDLLSQSINDKKQKMQIEAIGNSSRQLLDLINDLVDISRLEAKELPIIKSAVDLNQLMNNIREQFIGYRHSAKSEKLGFKLNIPGEQLIIITDEFRLGQVLNNLLSNAFKYTNSGKIEFGYRKHDEKNLLFFVKDSGIGISKENQEIVFNRFKQLEMSSEEVIRGTGLGLAISKGLTELLGGKMWLESEPKAGSTFYFTIPLEKITKGAVKINTRKPVEKVPRFEQRKILIVEDDPYSTKILRHFLEITGADLCFAEDGEKAMDLFNKEKFDLVLLDIRLPKKSGYDCVIEMKNLKPEVYIIAQTAYAMPEEIYEFRNKGFDDYISKPVDSGILYNIIERHLS